VEKKIEMVTSHEHDGIRLDVFLSFSLRISRSFAAKIIVDGHMMVDTIVRKPSFKLKDGMKVHGSYSLMDEKKPIAANRIPLDTIYEDPWIVVINKPAGIIVHPGAGNKDGTIVNALLAEYPEIRDVGEPDRPGIVHRLDKMTSGVMIAARRNDSYTILINAFKNHEHRREYVAICYGHMPQTMGTIETFMQRNPKDRKRMTSRTTEGRKAVTHWSTIKEWEGFSQLLLNLETGRTHQIRVHLSEMDHPIVGDAQYGGRKRINSIPDQLVRLYVKSLHRQMLHAATLCIKHPFTGKQLEFRSEMPQDMKDLIEVLDKREQVASPEDRTA
jgi:23S rRNA pseudouridine1911/1915/1917 synthase